jgi:restriction system protein
MAQSREVPSFKELMWPTLEALKSTGGSASNQELLTRVVQLMNLPEEIQNVPYRNGTLVEDRLHWARSYLRKVGAIDSSERGVWSITPAGRALTEADMQKLVTQVGEMSRQNRAQPEQHAPETADGDQLDEVWRDQLLSILQTMPPDAFERLAQRILRESGFIDVEVKGKSGDGGIDGIGILRVGLLSFRVFFPMQAIQGERKRRCDPRLSRCDGWSHRQGSIHYYRSLYCGREERSDT